MPVIAVVAKNIAIACPSHKKIAFRKLSFAHQSAKSLHTLRLQPECFGIPKSSLLETAQLLGGLARNPSNDLVRDLSKLQVHFGCPKKSFELPEEAWRLRTTNRRRKYLWGLYPHFRPFNLE
jgi:hypothetical protein